jgi:hypothetical protein
VCGIFVIQAGCVSTPVIARVKKYIHFPITHHLPTNKTNEQQAVLDFKMTSNSIVFQRQLRQTFGNHSIQKMIMNTSKDVLFENSAKSSNWNDATE